MWLKETGFSCGLEGLHSKGRNVVEGNWVQLWAGKVISDDRNGGSEETGFTCGLEDQELLLTRVIINIGKDCVRDRDWLKLRKESAEDKFSSESNMHSFQAGSKPWLNCKLDVCTLGHELVLGWLMKGLLQANTSGLWRWTLNILGYLAGLTEGWDQEWALNIWPKLELLATRITKLELLATRITSKCEVQLKRLAQ